MLVRVNPRAGAACDGLGRAVYNPVTLPLQANVISCLGIGPSRMHVFRQLPGMVYKLPPFSLVSDTDLEVSRLDWSSPDVTLGLFWPVNINSYMSLHVIQLKIIFSGLGPKILQEVEPELQRYFTVSFSTKAGEMEYTYMCVIYIYIYTFAHY